MDAWRPNKKELLGKGLSRGDWKQFVNVDAVWAGLRSIHTFLRWCGGFCVLVCFVIVGTFMMWLVFRLVLRAYQELRDVL